MRIGIDARKLHDFGIGTYIRNLLRQLARLDRDTEFVILAPAGRLRRARSTRRELPRGARNRRELFGVRAAPDSAGLRREGITLFHAPHYVLPPLVPCRSVVTIHDCIHLMFPQYLPSRLALTYARTSIALASRRAARGADCF